jgi:hypothetical protein
VSSPVLSIFALLICVSQSPFVGGTATVRTNVKQQPQNVNNINPEQVLVYGKRESKGREQRYYEDNDDNDEDEQEEA